MERVIFPENEILEWLKLYQEELEYASEYLEGRMSTDTVSLLKKNDELVGFIDIKLVDSTFFDQHDDREFIIREIDVSKHYQYLQTCNIRSSYQQNGIGKALVSELKKEATHTLLVYVTAVSHDFWLTQGFIPLNDDDYWLSFEKKHHSI